MPGSILKRKIPRVFSRKRAIEFQGVVTSISERYLRPERRQLESTQTLSLRNRCYVHVLAILFCEWVAVRRTR